MNIQLFFLLALATILLVHISTMLFPPQSFLETSCIMGQISLPSGNQKLIDCSSCLTYPLQLRQKGTIRVRSGTPEELKQGNRVTEYQLYANLYQQTECIQYECGDLSSERSFNNIDTVSKAGLELVSEISRQINNDIWQIKFQYDNSRKYEGLGKRTFLINFINTLFGSLIPYPLLPAKQFYFGLALKLRYTHPSQKNVDTIGKPIIKITQQSESVSDLLTLTILIVFTMAYKTDFFRRGQHTRVAYIALCFSFVAPWLVAILVLLTMAARRFEHAISIILYIVGIGSGYHWLIISAIVLSSAIFLKQHHTMGRIMQILWLGVVIVVARVLEIQSIVSMGMGLTFALGEQGGQGYQKVGKKERDRTWQMVEVDSIQH